MIFWNFKTKEIKKYSTNPIETFQLLKVSHNVEFSLLSSWRKSAWVKRSYERNAGGAHFLVLAFLFILWITSFHTMAATNALANNGRRKLHGACFVRVCHDARKKQLQHTPTPSRRSRRCARCFVYIKIHRDNLITFMQQMERMGWIKCDC